ncbi:MAG: ABC-F family ATP-binding cassette domain-containing protein [Paludibacteraceae bacterium]|nr:ABC-F family ATP-binding cassette domain-containing protein [Paludibacteraceae bacterium]
MVSYLQVEHLSKRFGDKVLFQDLSFGISEGQRVALVAPNGSGKTTLLSILFGDEDYQDGSIAFRRDLRIGYLKQHPQFDPSLSVMDACFASDTELTRVIRDYERLTARLADGLSVDENRYQQLLSRMDELKAWNFEADIKQILGRLNIHQFDQTMGQLSGGQQKRVALANVLIADPQLLILDEPTNHLDIEMVEWLEDFLNDSNMALLMVTHDRYFLDRVCSDILEIADHRMYHYRGNYSYFLQKKDERIAQQLAETERARNLYRRELDWMRRQPQARGTKARYRVQAFSEIEERARRRLEDKQLALEVKAQYIGSKIFEAKYISKAYGNVRILDNFYYNFSRYEKVGIVGKNGSGKSTFLKMLLGEVKPDSGTFDIGETVVFGYYSQEGLRFNESQKVIDVVRDVAEEISLGNGRRLSATQFLQLFLFTPEEQYNYVYKLSGGEKRRLHLCTVLMRNPNFLVLDEPTNDLDIATLNVLENYLIGFRGCVLVVSHDRFFMDKVVDHILAFEGDGRVKDYPGNYTDYRDWKRLQDEQAASRKKTQIPAGAPRRQEAKSSDDSARRKMTYKEKREFEALDAEIAALEAEKKQIEQQFQDGLSDLQRITELSSRLEDVNKLLDEKSMRWLELSELL